MVTLVPVSGLDDSQCDLFTRWAEVYAASGRAVLGDEHTAWGADELRELERSPHRRMTAAAAVQPDGEVVGAVLVVLRTRENPRVAFLSLAVHPDHRRRGVGSELLGWAEARAVEQGRSVFIAETEWPAGGTDAFGETFAPGRGYAPAQHVLRSTLRLPVDEVTLSAVAADDGDANTPDHALETSVDGIPDSWLEDRAELQRRMSTDAPLGDLQLEEEDWDAERMRGEYDVLASMGRRVVETVARHLPSGRLVGYTQVQVSPETPTLGYQQDTLVVREHRGHVLGLRLKAANTLAVMEHLPELTAIRTWNAEDNAHMLAVNQRLGYAVDAHRREWQKVLG
ncbi:GNAT family N-acetyltransferase [Knoellia sp. 3-2P3]|uniref:GNAT family N-acetyltransferase n=1 Tax=unclassified Knoellia TaxID=2618719 RepID=UPI0023DBEA5E|nr:GNAT family N-acetyltransferase [Knoellia sp. 3-2P3]MDF2093776.1 GNAT family N-acetyltransferase [Knoellia sp. 3-2P3]